MGITAHVQPQSYDDGRTKQAFKDAADINKLLAKAQREGTISHLAKYEAVYGDFSDIGDLLTAHERLGRAQAIFDELPGELRREFNNSPQAFFEFVNAPDNADKLQRVLPALARPGRQAVQPVRRTAPAETAPASTPAPEQNVAPEATQEASG